MYLKFVEGSDEIVRVLIFRTNGNIVNLSTYNLQEIGIAKALCIRGIQGDVMYYGGNDPTHEEEIGYNGKTIRIIWAKGVSIAGNGFFFGLEKILDEYDIIQVCEYDQFYSMYLAFYSRYKGRVCMTHGPYYSPFNAKYNFKIKVIDKIWISKKQKARIWCFAKSNYSKHFLERRGFQRIVVTGVGVDIDKFGNCDSDIQSEMEKEIRAFKGTDRLLLYIGQISDRRSTLFLINLMGELVKKDLQIKLLIIGNGQKRYKQKCLSLIKKLELEEKIYYRESITQNQVSCLYKLADIFVFPTKYEIFGMVMLEAMYFGLPVITTDNGGSSTVIHDNQNGYILPLVINEWINKIIELKGSSEVKRIGEAAHRTIIEHYTWSEVVKEMVNAYEDILLSEV